MMSGDASNIPGLDTILRGEILRKDALISQLVGQNKELMGSKERQDLELAGQRETLQVAALQTAVLLVVGQSYRNAVATILKYSI